MIIREPQLRTLEHSTFESYVERLTDHLLMIEGQSSNEVASIECHDDARRRVNGALSQVQELGFECEGDATPAAMLILRVNEQERSNGVFPWVFAVLFSTVAPPFQRMQAIMALLEPTDKHKLFGSH